MIDRTPRMSAAAYRELMGLDAYAPDTGPAAAKARPNKFGAKRTAGVGGRVYDSAAESRAARDLELERQAGGCVAVIPQPSFPMGKDEGGRDVRYRADFLVILDLAPEGYGPGAFVAKLIDIKGVMTPASKAKMAALRTLYGIDVQVER